MEELKEKLLEEIDTLSDKEKRMLWELLCQSEAALDNYAVAIQPATARPQAVTPM